MPSDSALLTCRLCGHEHRRIPLAPGARALCVNCHTVLAKGAYGGPDASLAFAVAGLVLAVPAALLPMVTAQKVGNERVAHLFTGIHRLIHSGMSLQAIPVLLFGALLPLVLMGTLAGLLLPPRFGRISGAEPLLSHLAEAIRHWAMPEVQVLAVLVAIVKLGSLITIKIGPGFWCYAAMSFMLLLAYRSYDLGPSAARRSPAGPVAATL